MINEIKHSVDKALQKVVKDRAAEEILIKDWQKQQDSLKKLKEHYNRLCKVRILFQEAAERTQKQLEYHINGLVSTALAAIWDDPYTFALEFVLKRGSTEANLWVVRDSEKMKPLDASGGGVVDIISLALLMSFWSLTKSTRPLLFLDEPLKHLSEDLQSRASDMLKMLSTKLGIQIIMVTHEQALLNAVDKEFNTTLRKGISKVIPTTKRELEDGKYVSVYNGVEVEK